MILLYDKKEMATSDQLARWCLQNKCEGFLGVYPGDELVDRVPSSRWCVICNYDGARGPGGHWVCAVGGGGRAMWFGGYGLRPDDPTELALLGGRTSFTHWLDRVAPRGWSWS